MLSRVGGKHVEDEAFITLQVTIGLWRGDVNLWEDLSLETDTFVQKLFEIVLLLEIMVE